MFTTASSVEGKTPTSCGNNLKTPGSDRDDSSAVAAKESRGSDERSRFLRCRNESHACLGCVTWETADAITIYTWFGGTTGVMRDVTVRENGSKTAPTKRECSMKN